MEEKKPTKTTDRQYYMFALRIIGDFGASIAIPVVAFVLVGQYFDERYQRSPLFTIIGFVLSALISGKIIHKKAKRYGTQYQHLVDNEKK
jgi:F0F1-type ATP synthase assembly protein I